MYFRPDSLDSAQAFKRIGNSWSFACSCRASICRRCLLVLRVCCVVKPVFRIITLTISRNRHLFQWDGLSVSQLNGPRVYLRTCKNSYMRNQCEFTKNLSSRFYVPSSLRSCFKNVFTPHFPLLGHLDLVRRCYQCW